LSYNYDRKWLEFSQENVYYRLALQQILIHATVDSSYFPLTGDDGQHFELSRPL